MTNLQNALNKEGFTFAAKEFNIPAKFFDKVEDMYLEGDDEEEAAVFTIRNGEHSISFSKFFEGEFAMFDGESSSYSSKKSLARKALNALLEGDFEKFEELM
ncbi:MULTISPECIES: hypothetical protein [unclassified Exiguobacterium]|uniref:hypothetical protein n=1 Tax=unclassified Exiguobacterium TaxID=2644629 RepID=UPI001BE86E0A|nr:MULTISPECIES: hypothetical protein [unclassified Exiguobacterium]